MDNTRNLAESGPFIRGSLAWVERERARSLLGCACINPNEIPRNQAYGEQKAHLQQVDTSSYVEQVRKEIAERKK